jgi:hypothetical protein
MKINTLFLSLALTIPVMSFAQQFYIKDASTLYDVKLDVTCEKDACFDKGNVILYKKGSPKVFQKMTSDDLSFYLDEDFKPTTNIVELYGEQSPLIFDDFNFDGSEDVAVRNGSYGSYGGPTYDVYVYNKTRKKFILSDDLSSLTQENLGMFQVDPDRKRLITFNKSGCCYHITQEYIVEPKKGLIEVKSLVEDARHAVGGDQVEVKELNLINGKWVESIKYYPIDEYYK